MLHVTNGEAVSIPQTGLPGQVVYWSDILHDGPVPRGLPLQELSRVRERFIADFFAVPLSEVSFAQRDEAIMHFRDHEEVILWFEHDLYDQLQLIQVLDWLSHQDVGATRITVISVDSYLGPMRPEQLVPLFGTRHTVTAVEFRTAQAAWTAFCSPEPSELLEQLGSDTSALPFLRRALLRHLQQFPALRNGLSRAERQILEVAESGLHEFHELFPAAQKLEESIWMGDATFLQCLQGLVTARQPLVRSQNSGFESTSFGRLVLEGKEDHVRVNGINRWLGGVHLYEGATVWRWDEAAQTIRP
ncbi:MAG: hypothetical protein WD696_20180 [Bryobacteraceae bacterium]